MHNLVFALIAQRCHCFCLLYMIFLELRNSVHCVFLDFAKPFDSVAHKHFLVKLQCLAIGIDGELLQWICSF